MSSMRRQKDMTLEDEPPRSEGVHIATEEEQSAITNSSRMSEATVPKQKRCSVVKYLVGKVKSDAVKNNIA